MLAEAVLVGGRIKQLACGGGQAVIDELGDWFLVWRGTNLGGEARQVQEILAREPGTKGAAPLFDTVTVALEERVQRRDQLGQEICFVGLLAFLVGAEKFLEKRRVYLFG